LQHWPNHFESTKKAIGECDVITIKQYLEIAAIWPRCSTGVSAEAKLNRDILLVQGWAINLALGPLSEGRVQRRAIPSNGNWNKSQFKLTSALAFTVMSWRIFQIWRFSWMLPRATENAVAGWYLPTFVLAHS